MATIDLGKIKLVWRGTYAGGTAYTVDDVVQHTDSGLTSSFICTTNSTGNAPSTGGSVHSSWAYLAKGGVAGTDVGTTITTQGDILYRDGSGLQRLAKPASNKYLQNTSGGVLSWETVSSDMVKLNEFTHSGSNVTSINYDNIFSATYPIYKVFIYAYIHSGTGSQAWCRTIDSSGSVDSGSNYDYAFWYQTTGGSTGISSSSSATHFAIGHDAGSDDDKPAVYELTFYEPYNTSRRKMIKYACKANCNNNADTRVFDGGAQWGNSSTAMRGIQILGQGTSNIIKSAKCTVYGLKGQG